MGIAGFLWAVFSAFLQGFLGKVGVKTWFLAGEFVVFGGGTWSAAGRFWGLKSTTRI
ncbi:hypothetical protein [Granulicella sp. L60]|uniref:hypothetical protein n=1 Tax=Granulicella sp. L60 TaxID=1641866 RepID=UPI00131E6FDE|nr:hypothetical protein [Granulicella sp. L60]